MKLLPVVLLALGTLITSCTQKSFPEDAKGLAKLQQKINLEISKATLDKSNDILSVDALISNRSKFDVTIMLPPKVLDKVMLESNFMNPYSIENTSQDCTKKEFYPPAVPIVYQHETMKTIATIPAGESLNFKYEAFEGEKCEGQEQIQFTYSMEKLSSSTFFEFIKKNELDKDPTHTKNVYEALKNLTPLMLNSNAIIVGK